MGDDELHSGSAAHAVSRGSAWPTNSGFRAAAVCGLRWPSGRNVQAMRIPAHSGLCSRPRVQFLSPLRHGRAEEKAEAEGRGTARGTESLELSNRGQAPCRHTQRSPHRGRTHWPWLCLASAHVILESTPAASVRNRPSLIFASVSIVAFSLLFCTARSRRSDGQ